jgi:hypothetical protein
MPYIDARKADATSPPHDGAFTQTGGLPLPVLLPPVGLCSLYCAVTPIDNRGRLADRSPVRAVGWAPSQPITIAVTSERVLIVRPDGPHSITRQGHLRIPTPIRHLCGIVPGDRFLTVAMSDSNVVVVYPMAELETILTRNSAALLTARNQP